MKQVRFGLKLKQTYITLDVTIITSAVLWCIVSQYGQGHHRAVESASLFLLRQLDHCSNHMLLHDAASASR